MKALILEKNGKLVFKDTAMPIVRKGEVLVKVLGAGICSSDIPRSFENGAYHYPLVLGHEMVGEVMMVKKFQNVVVYPLIYCGKCEFCRNGKINLCSDYDYLGSRRNGGFAEYVIAPKKNLIPVPTGLEPSLAVLTEPMAVLVHAIKRAKLSRSDRILIIGDGSMGLMMCRVLTGSGYKNVYLSGKHPHKLNIAKDFKAKTVASHEVDQTHKNYFDVVFELAGSSSAYQTAILATKPHGQVVFISNIGQDLNLPKQVFSQILRKEIKMTGSWNSLIPDWLEAMNILRKTPEMAKVISHLTTIDDGQRLMRSIYDRKEKDFIKAVLI